MCKTNLGLYVRGSNEMLLKSVKKVGIFKTENLMDKEDFKEKYPNMDSLFVKCLKK